MVRQQNILPCLFIFIIVFSVVIVPVAKGCKDIVIASSATAGDYSLLLKVRDPSRDGLQVLCRVPKGTQYTYHHPWTGRPWDFIVNRTFIGVATQGDTLPHIVKAGMVLTDAGLAFGDADTMSRWVNPTKNAWDDFDWIRYACQTAGNEDEAISLLTTKAVDTLHATGVSENLFMVGPKRTVVIEADAIHHTTKDVTDVWVMSNYPKDLWRTQHIRSLPIASSYDTQKEAWARRGTVIHLGSLCGVRIVHLSPLSITAQVFPWFIFKNSGYEKEVTISLGQRATVGPYSVNVLEIDGNSARISVCTAVYAWEQKLLEHIEPSIGTITIQDMIRWSRLHSMDLDGLRPMCEDRYMYEGSMIFKIQKEHPGFISSGWFAANHACCSIYVPVHICDDDFYNPYETGEAATLSLALLHRYGHGNITSLCESVETVFLFENDINELLAYEMIQSGINITFFLTTLDRAIQEQAFLTQQLWLSAPNGSRGILEHLWIKNYRLSVQRMQQVSVMLTCMQGSEALLSIIEKIIQSIHTSLFERSAIQERTCTDYN